MSAIEVVRTYLEMLRPEQLRAVPLDDDARVDRVSPCTVSFFRYLYREVGRAYRWTDRLNWTETQCREHLTRPEISIWLLTVAGAPAGYFELSAAASGETEIAYFGLLPAFVGRGLGKQLLSAAVERAWSTGAKRVWLHTCTLDHPAALPNYRARGFLPVREERYTVPATTADAPA